MASNRIEELAKTLATMPREQLVQMLRDTKYPFTMDFSDDYLQAVSLESLRHIVLAASLHSLVPAPNR